MAQLLNKTCLPYETKSAILSVCSIQGNFCLNWFLIVNLSDFKLIRSSQNLTLGK